MTRHEVIAEVWRSGFLEGMHHGSVAALHASGAEALRIGEPDAPMFPRSSNKPLQALSMLRCGLDLDGELLALACASHSGEDCHLDGVTRILGRAGLTVDALQCTPDLPIGETARQAYLASGGRPTRLHMNCSGKHAAMLLTCVINGWPTDSYRDPAHPLQRAIRDGVAEFAGEPVAATGVDGCGAPLYAISLLGLARAFRRLATAAPGTKEARIADAMRAYPEWVGGSGAERTDSVLMQRLPGAIAKDGAEGVSALALPDGRAVTLKVADGAARARPVVMIAALRRLGVDVSAAADLATAPILGHGARVGEVRPAGRVAVEPALC